MKTVVVTLMALMFVGGSAGVAEAQLYKPARKSAQKNAAIVLAGTGAIALIGSVLTFNPDYSRGKTIRGTIGGQQVYLTRGGEGLIAFANPLGNRVRKTMFYAGTALVLTGAILHWTDSPVKVSAAPTDFRVSYEVGF